MNLSLEEKIRVIEQSPSFSEIPPEAMPTAHRNDYYFVSYSHLDYKEVLKDILRLEELGVNIWYDREMHIGENWQEVAQLYISRYQCIGIIFYLTENSLASPACNQEVEYVLQNNKRYLTVNKPLPGCGAQSGHAMLRELQKRGLSFTEQMTENFRKAFPDEMLYLPMETKIEKKAQAILSIPKEDLFQTEKDIFGAEEGQHGLSVLLCRDPELPYLDLSKKQTQSDDSCFITSIGECAFTNCMKLKRVLLSPSLRSIGESAFRNCTSLSEIDLSATKDVHIGSRAFRNCTGLHRIDLSRAGSVGEEAFFRTALERVEIPGSVRLNERAFFGCAELREVSFSSPIKNGLAKETFASCEKLETVGTLASAVSKTPKRLPTVDSACFYGCKALKKIRFEGSWDFRNASGAFEKCESLETMDPGTTGSSRIPAGFVMGCGNLKSFVHGDRMTEIGKFAFRDCRSLRSFPLEQVTIAENGAFRNAGLEKAYLKSAEIIGANAFRGSKNLKSVTIGENCGFIGDSAFAECPSLISLKLLCETFPFRGSKQKAVYRDGFKRFEDDSRNVFRGTDLRIVYLRSAEVLTYLRENGVTDRVKYLYVDENITLTEAQIGEFELTESEESGYRKYQNPKIDLPLDLSEEIDPADDELNAPDPRRENFRHSNGLKRFTEDPYREFPEFLGEECLIKHIRRQLEHPYFVEQISSDENGRIEALTVSVHTGKSFRLPGNLIENIRHRPGTECVRDGFSVTGTFRLEHPDLFVTQNVISTELDGRCCRIDGKDTFWFGEIFRATVWLAEPSRTHPIKDKEGRFSLKSVIVREPDGFRAISAQEIEKITVFNDNFAAEKVFEKTK